MPLVSSSREAISRTTPSKLAEPGRLRVKFSHISAALKQGSNGDSHVVGFWWFAMNAIDAMRLFSIAIRFPNLDLAGCRLTGQFTGWLFPSEVLKTPLAGDNVWRRHIGPKLKAIGLGWVNFQV